MERGIFFCGDDSEAVAIGYFARRVAERCRIRSEWGDHAERPEMAQESFTRPPLVEPQLSFGRKSGLTVSAFNPEQLTSVGEEYPMPNGPEGAVVVGVSVWNLVKKVSSCVKTLFRSNTAKGCSTLATSAEASRFAEQCDRKPSCDAFLVPTKSQNSGKPSKLRSLAAMWSSLSGRDIMPRPSADKSA